MNISIGDKVYWHDPDNETCSGIYKVNDVGTDRTVYLNDYDGTIVEALESELEDPINALLKKVNALTDYANKLADAALSYGDAVDDEMESGDYHLDDTFKTNEEIEEHNANVDAACNARRKLQDLIDKRVDTIA